VTTILALLLVLCGSLFVLVAAVGLLRMPDLFTRMHGASKAATLGSMLAVFGAAAWFGDVWTLARALMIAVFLMLTAPVAAHVLARAAASSGCPLVPGTVVDERPLRDRTEDCTGQGGKAG
jgi:multicomponent Na+:H+ antiporter subunit G